MGTKKKAPRFDRRNPGSQQASKAKKRSSKSGTRPEVALRKCLWARGWRYRLHAKDLPGKPDLVFRRKRVAVFVDGDFWHGRNWERARQRLARHANGDYWVAKIEYNIERDARQTEELKQAGWRVIRLWEREVRSDPEQAADAVAKLLKDECERRAGMSQGGPVSSKSGRKHTR